MISPSEFVARMNLSGLKYPMTSTGAVVGATTPARAGEAQLVATDNYSFQWLNKIMTGVWNASPLGATSKVMVPLMNGEKRAAAEALLGPAAPVAKAAANGAANAASSAVSAVKDGISSVTTYAKILGVVALVLVLLYVFALISQPIMLLRSAK